MYISAIPTQYTAWHSMCTSLWAKGLLSDNDPCWQNKKAKIRLSTSACASCNCCHHSSAQNGSTEAVKHGGLFRSLPVVELVTRRRWAPTLNHHSAHSTPSPIPRSDLESRILAPPCRPSSGSHNSPSLRYGEIPFYTPKSLVKVTISSPANHQNLRCGLCRAAQSSSSSSSQRRLIGSHFVSVAPCICGTLYLPLHNQYWWGSNLIKCPSTKHTLANFPGASNCNNPNPPSPATELELHHARFGRRLEPKVVGVLAIATSWRRKNHREGETNGNTQKRLNTHLRTQCNANSNRDASCHYSRRKQCQYQRFVSDELCPNQHKNVPRQRDKYPNHVSWKNIQIMWAPKNSSTAA